MPATGCARPARRAFRKAASAAAVRSCQSMPPSPSRLRCSSRRSKCLMAPSSCASARTLEGPQGGFAERPRRTALLLGCDIAFRGEIVYGAALPAAGRRRVRRELRHAGRAGLPALRTRRLPGAGGTAGHPSARPRRSLDRIERFRLSVGRLRQHRQGWWIRREAGKLASSTEHLRHLPIGRSRAMQESASATRACRRSGGPLEPGRAVGFPAGLPVGRGVELRRHDRPLSSTDDSWTVVFWRSLWAAAFLLASWPGATAGAAR